MIVFFLIFMMIESAMLCLLALLIGGFLPFYTSGYQELTLPFMLMTALGCLCALCGLLIKKTQKIFLVLSSLLLLALPIPAFYAIVRWSPDDDGSGVGWSAFIVVGSLVAALISLGVLVCFSKGICRKDTQYK